jgi:hypothetical protein
MKRHWHCRHLPHADCELQSQPRVQDDLNGGEVGTKEVSTSDEAWGRHHVNKNMNLGGRTWNEFPLQFAKPL